MNENINEPIVPGTVTRTADPTAQPPVAPRIQNSVVASIQPDNRPPDFDATTGKATAWYITCIKDGQQSVRPCSEAVWVWAQQAQPWFDTRAEWIINVDLNSDNKVVGVTRKPIMDKGPLSPRLDISNDYLMLQKLGSTFEPINLPIQFGTPRLEEAIAAMNEAGRARAGEILAKKFLVKKVISMENDNVIYELDLAKQPGQ